MGNRPVRASVALDVLLLVALTATLIHPLFKMRFMDNWASIESTFIADARYLSDHWPNPRWQPLWYNGTRFDYVYPPALRYGTAALTHYYPRMTAAKAYHIYTAFFYCVAVAGVYFLVRAASGSRRAAWLAAILAGLWSPTYLFTAIPAVADMAKDNPMLAPQRLNALVRYGEGPHMTAFGLIPLALAAASFALRRFEPWPVLWTVVFTCLVVSNNFYAASAFALVFPLLVWSLWITHQDHRIFARASVICGLAYGLTAFWLTPNYLLLTLRNMQYVSHNGNAWSLWIFLAQVIAFLLVTDRWARGRRERAWAVFVVGFVLVFLLQVLGNMTFDFRVIGEPTRWVPELDLALILAWAMACQWLWRHQRVVWRRLGWVAAAVSLVPAGMFAAQAWRFIPPQGDPLQRFEFHLSRWIHANLPGQRVYATGSFRFWLDAWHDIPHVGGGSEQGLINGSVIDAQWELNLGEDLETARQWLDATGADAIVLHGPQSQEPFRDIVKPDRFRQWPLLHDDGKGNQIYRVPRRFAGIARAVNTASARAVPERDRAGQAATLVPYAKMLNEGADVALTVAWRGSDAFEVSGLATLGAGQSVVVLETYEANWRAFGPDGAALPIARDALGHMRLDQLPRKGDRVRFELGLSRQNQAGRALTALTVLALAGYAIRYRRREPLL